MKVFNRYLVSARGKQTVILNTHMLYYPMSADEAMELAAWIVAVSAPHASKPFTEVLEEVCK